MLQIKIILSLEGQLRLFIISEHFCSSSLLTKEELYPGASISHHLLDLDDEFVVSLDEAVEKTDSGAGSLGCYGIQLP